MYLLKNQLTMCATVILMSDEAWYWWQLDFHDGRVDKDKKYTNILDLVLDRHKLLDP